MLTDPNLARSGMNIESPRYPSGNFTSKLAQTGPLKTTTSAQSSDGCRKMDPTPTDPNIVRSKTRVENSKSPSEKSTTKEALAWPSKITMSEQSPGGAQKEGAHAHRRELRVPNERRELEISVGDPPGRDGIHLPTLFSYETARISIDSYHEPPMARRTAPNISTLR